MLLAFVSLGFGVVCHQKWRKAKASRKQRSRQGQGQGDLAHAYYYIRGCEDEVIKLQSYTHEQKEQINRKEMAAESIAGTTNILLNKTLSLYRHGCSVSLLIQTPCWSFPPPSCSLPPVGSVSLSLSSLPFLVLGGGVSFVGLQSPLRSLWRLPVGLGSLNKTPVPTHTLSLYTGMPCPAIPAQDNPLHSALAVERDVGLY